MEDELLQQQNKSAELALSLTAQPHDAGLQEQLKESLVKMHVDATLSDNPEVNERAQAAIDILDHPDFTASQQSLAQIVTTIVPLHTEPMGQSQESLTVLRRAFHTLKGSSRMEH